jgi:hypothetical protein
MIGRLAGHQAVTYFELLSALRSSARGPNEGRRRH